MQLDDPGDLRFRAPPRRPRRQAESSGTWLWWALALACAIGFVLLIRQLLERMASTAGPSPEVATTAQLHVVDTAADQVRANRVQPAGVPMVYRCVDGAGAVAFQSQPCGPGQRTTRTIAAPPDVEPRRRALTRYSPPPDAVYGVRAGSGMSAAQARCNIARNNREAVLRQVGLKRTFDLLRQLDDAVNRACKEVERGP